MVKMKSVRYVPAPGSQEEKMLQSIRDIFSTIPTTDGKPVTGVSFVDEDQKVVTDIKFADIPPTR